MPDVIKMYVPATLAALQISVIVGDPPVDQSALVTQLQGQVSQLTGDLAAANTNLAAATTLATQRRTVIDDMLQDLGADAAADTQSDAARESARTKGQAAP